MGRIAHSASGAPHAMGGGRQVGPPAEEGDAPAFREGMLG